MKADAKARISSQQIKIIYTLGSELGLVDRFATRDQLHEMVESITGKMHISELTSDDANIVIDRLKDHMRGFERYKSRKNTASRPGMANQAQINKMWALMFELRKYDSSPPKVSLQKRLRGFLKKYAGIDDTRFMTAAQAWRVIEGLKGLVEREKGKVLGNENKN